MCSCVSPFSTTGLHAHICVVTPAPLKTAYSIKYSPDCLPQKAENVGPNLIPNCLQRLLAEGTSKQSLRAKVGVVVGNLISEPGFEAN